jgi:hypothetical protein
VDGCRIVFCVDLLRLSGEESLFADSPFLYFYSVESLLHDVSVAFGVLDPVSATKFERYSYLD